MKRNAFLAAVCLGVMLTAAGCGEAPKDSGGEELKPAEQGLEMEPTECYYPDCGGGGGGGGGGSTEVGMTLTQYQQLAGQNTSRCVGGIDWNSCMTELNYALSRQIISRSAYDWGVANGYYPAVDRYDRIAAVCKCGCFEAGTAILTEGSNGFAEWKAAKKIKDSDKLISLDEASALSQPGFKAKSIKALTRGEELPAIYVFGMDNGRQLKVTQNHGMLLSDGRVVEARTLSVGAEFVALDGALVKVTDLTQVHTKHDVFNFEVDAADKAGHFVVAEGVLVGDLAWQNQLSRELGSISVRR